MPVLSGATAGRKVEGRGDTTVRSPAAAGTPPLLRTLGWCTAALLIASALLPMLPRLFAAEAAITLEIGGDLEQTRPDEVRTAVTGMLNRDFHALDLVAVKAAVEELPWVAAARVERAWPDAVRIHVVEHRAWARWGEDALLSDRNVIFVPDALDGALAVLPRLQGPARDAARVRAAFEELRTKLDGTPFVPAHLALNERGEWTALTGDGIELRLGRGAPADAVEWLAGPVRTALEGRLQEVTYVDLHYINGFAVGWRERAGDGSGDAAAVDGG